MFLYYIKAIKKFFISAKNFTEVKRIKKAIQFRMALQYQKLNFKKL